MPESDVLKKTQHIYNLVALCSQKNIQHAIVCPGSRCAPLLIACDLHPEINTISVTDERSAAFIALGIAQQTNKPVILVCTSGTAGQNFAPAVTEAFYQHVPLIVLTADRPPKWIDQWDGQTIHQKHLFIDHIKEQMTFIAGKSSLQKAGQLLNQCTQNAPGPIHLNIPVSKPFYPLSKGDIPSFGSFDISTALEDVQFNLSEKQLDVLKKQLKTSKKILIHFGQYHKDTELSEILQKLGIPFIGDIISNIDNPERTDVFFNTSNKELQPDLLITVGRSVISEKHKQYFRLHKPKAHWHIGLGIVGDPFQTTPHVIVVKPLTFFKAWLTDFKPTYADQSSYQKILKKRSGVVFNHVKQCLDVQQPFNQYIATALALQYLPKNSVLHLANSMTVRVANNISFNKKQSKNNETDEPNYQDIEVFSNRGTSGIDGCLSTAVGHAIANPERINTLIIGDLAFLYDRNGLWLNQALPKNLKIIIMNNAGGGIFHLIPGPSKQESSALFSTPHQRTAQLTAQEFDIKYMTAHTKKELITQMQPFFNPSLGIAIMEIFTDMKNNEQFFRTLESHDEMENN